MAELVVPPLVRGHLAARALSPGAGDEPHDQVRLLTEAIRHRLLRWRDHRFGVRLGGHLGVREFDTAFQRSRLSAIALVERLPILVIARGGVLRVEDIVHESALKRRLSTCVCGAMREAMARIDQYDR